MLKGIFKNLKTLAIAAMLFNVAGFAEAAGVVDFEGQRIASVLKTETSSHATEMMFMRLKNFQVTEIAWEEAYNSKGGEGMPYSIMIDNKNIIYDKGNNVFYAVVMKDFGYEISGIELVKYNLDRKVSKVIASAVYAEKEMSWDMQPKDLVRLSNGSVIYEIKDLSEDENIQNMNWNKEVQQIVRYLKKHV